ncbi:VIT1/CCC1 transporter family protein [Haloplasma contractile]|uniref:VIT domain containing protein n=1 Tax=Haloplasma contractile SSD-17B TaxID=1033810 RepID=U2EDG3_9MOLU|nr:VIT1/CCC1 transporter family protein [Haloplasma contractile]ERJ13018.1 VIT domain containing protein [Haloplasma contractile SSD-17B]
MNKLDLKLLMVEQKNEITAHFIYGKLAKRLKKKNDPNASLLQRISDDEIEHYRRIEQETNRVVKPKRFKVFFYYWISVIFGFTFGLKLLEKDEEKAQASYDHLSEDYSFFKEIFADEDRHEKELLNMLNEERLTYMGSVVLGLNDALVELTGALAGFTFAFNNTSLIAIIGLITGVSASFSMAASEYLSTKQEDGDNAIKASIYTGLAYITTVIFLILPFLLLENAYASLGVSLGIAVFIIMIFNYYISVAKDYNFTRRFLEMTAISLGVAVISFAFGFAVNHFIDIPVA